MEIDNFGFLPYKFDSLGVRQGDQHTLLFALNTHGVRSIFIKIVCREYSPDRPNCVADFNRRYICIYGYRYCISKKRMSDYFLRNDRPLGCSDTKRKKFPPVEVYDLWRE